MEHPSSNNITLQNRSQTDYSLDEHYFNNTSSKSFNLRQIHFLRKENPVTFFTQSGKKVSATLMFSEDYRDMLIFIKGQQKSIPTHEIKEISQSFIIQVQREEDNLFPVRIKTHSKQYLFAFFNSENRSEWCESLDILLKFMISHADPSPLKDYCEVIIRSQDMASKISTLNENKKVQQIRLKKLEKKTKKSEKNTLEEIVKELLIKVEIKLYKRKIKEIKGQIESLESEMVLISKKRNNLVKAITRKDEEAGLLRDSLQGFKDQIFKISQKETKKYSMRKTWENILPFLTFSELVELGNASQSLKKLVFSYQNSQENWKILAKFELSPRFKSWPIYMNFFSNIFYPAPLSKSKILNFSLSIISKFSLPVQEMFISFCKTFSLSACFEELAKVSNFIFCIAKSHQNSFVILSSLVHPPFYILEIWKPGLLRLRLGIYQVQKVLKLRHPHLSKHFKEIDISIDYIIAPWIGSIFTCFFLPSEENKGLQRIWDLFLIYGWDSLITTCLALLSMSQSKVIGESLDHTLNYYEKKLDDKEICKALATYSVDPSLLNDLEKSFYTTLSPTHI